MSCEIQEIAKLLDVTKCKEWFSDRGDRKNQNWLRECLISFSPSGEIFTVAKKQSLVVFTSKWDSAELGDIKVKYSITWEGNPCNKSGDITSVLCLPLLSNNQSASGADWTCIVVGFSSGVVKFYTENMDQLMFELLHAEPVIQIKYGLSIAAKQPGIHSDRISDRISSHSGSNEIIYVLYKTVICIINGFSLFQTLRGLRSRLARQSASLQGIALDSNLPMHFKKYVFTDQDAITDACFIGQASPNIFDHLVTTSFANGFHSNYRPSSSQTSLVIATGRKPFLGFHYTIEGKGNPVLADVALAVASKIKESVAVSLPGWFGFGNKSTLEEEKLKVSQEHAEQLECRFGLCDLWRHGSSIATSPDYKFSAVTDSLGRILLIENSSGVARRLWKGYREAQCAFLDVAEDTEKNRHRKGKSCNSNSVGVIRRILFIVVYAPRKGLIEIFTVQQGPCIASFKVPKNGHLIYTQHGLLGFSAPSSKKKAPVQYPVIFLSEEGVKEIVVPFHCGLRNDNINKIRDLHILKKMKKFLKEAQKDDAQYVEVFESFVRDLKTNDIKLQLIEMLIFNKEITVNAFMSVLKIFTTEFREKDNVGFNENFLIFVESLKKVIDFYIFLKNLNDQSSNDCSLGYSISNNFSLSKYLLLTDRDWSSILKVINLIKGMEKEKRTAVKVTFAEEQYSSLSQFLSCFDFNNFINPGAKVDEAKNFYLNFKSDLNCQKMNEMGEFLFSCVIYGNQWLNDWTNHVKECKLDPTGLIKCLLTFWMHKNTGNDPTQEIESFVETIKIICSLVGPNLISVKYNKPSPWWMAVRNFLRSSPCSITCLLAALACRAVTITIEQMKELSQTCKVEKSLEAGDQELKDISTQNNDWENVSQDTWEWDVLITKLEDVSVLNAVLKINSNNDVTPMDYIEFEFCDLSLNSILEKGNGYVSELVSKWLIQFGLDASKLVNPSDVEFSLKKNLFKHESMEFDNNLKSCITAEDEESQEVKNSEATIIMSYIAILKEKFPYSLTSSALLSNICWEYMMHWHRTPNNLSYLQLALSCLSNIPSINLKYGLSYMCWSTYVLPKFSTVAKLVNKFGKTPNDKFCVQEVNFTSLQIPVFFELSTDLLNIMLESGILENDKFEFNEEELWQNEVIKNTPSLVTLALSQPKLNDELIDSHYQLSTVMHMISELNLKVSKPYSSLFDSVVLSEFFTDFAKYNQLSSRSCNVGLTNSRTQFLYKVISGAVQTIEVVENIPSFPVSESPGYMPKTCLNVSKATKWLRKCFDLAQMWGISLDDLRRHHVCELYSYGYDRLAEENIPSVDDFNTLASQLLVICGKRFKTFIHNTSGFSKKLSYLSPNLSTWLESLDSKNIKNLNIQLHDIQTILSYILTWGPSKAEEMRLVLAMVESIPDLENSSY